MLKLVARFLLWSTGWTLKGAPPTEYPKCVMIAAPHTSNWDMIYMVAAGAMYDLTFTFLMKHTVFWWPLGAIVTALGGMPINRRSRHDVVAQITDAFNKADRLVIAVPAEGTRSRQDYWKSGFYHMARGAGVPIVLSYLDWGRKQAGFGPVIHPSGDVRADMNLIRAFYADKQGKYPERFGPIRLKDEERQDDADDVAAAS